MSDEFLPEQDQGPEAAGEEPTEEELKTPFSFKLMVALTVVYLGWRLIQGIVWVVEKLTS